MYCYAPVCEYAPVVCLGSSTVPSSVMLTIALHFACNVNVLQDKLLPTGMIFSVSWSLLLG